MGCFALIYSIPSPSAEEEVSLARQLNRQANTCTDGRIDLHLHTTYSDGLYSPEQLVQTAVKLGLQAIAVTDHDTVSGLEITQQIADKYGIQFVPGVEISAYTEEDGEIHVLGYFIDPENPFLVNALRHLKTVRLKRIERMVGCLQELGFEIHSSSIRSFAGNGSVLGRPHLARAMVQHGIVSSVNEAFERYIARGKPAFIPKIGLSFHEAIHLILQAGGIPIYAHPGLSKKDALIPKLLNLGIRGLEVFHSEHSQEDIQRYAEIVERNNLLATGGSDCHGGSKTQKPLIGTVPVPYSILEQLRAAVL
jgi:predicted metal-dependent phosphoesterase TrpH